MRLNPAARIATTHLALISLLVVCSLALVVSAVSADSNKNNKEGNNDEDSSSQPLCATYGECNVQNLRDYCKGKYPSTPHVCKCSPPETETKLCYCFCEKRDASSSSATQDDEQQKQEEAKLQHETAPDRPRFDVCRQKRERCVEKARAAQEKIAAGSTKEDASGSCPAVRTNKSKYAKKLQSCCRKYSKCAAKAGFLVPDVYPQCMNEDEGDL